MFKNMKTSLQKSITKTTGQKKKGNLKDLKRIKSREMIAILVMRPTNKVRLWSRKKLKLSRQRPKREMNHLKPRPSPTRNSIKKLRKHSQTTKVRQNLKMTRKNQVVKIRNMSLFQKLNRNRRSRKNQKMRVMGKMVRSPLEPQQKSLRKLKTTRGMKSKLNLLSRPRILPIH
jgi:hypothetical protein